MSSVRELLQAHALSPSKVTVRPFLAERDEIEEETNPIPPQNYILIEGDRVALKFLANLILAQVDSDYGCTLDLHPGGAGSNHFSEASTIGILIHRLPCDLHPGNVVR